MLSSHPPCDGSSVPAFAATRPMLARTKTTEGLTHDGRSQDARMDGGAVPRPVPALRVVPDRGLGPGADGRLSDESAGPAPVGPAGPARAPQPGREPRALRGAGAGRPDDRRGQCEHGARREP